MSYKKSYLILLLSCLILFSVTSISYASSPTVILDGKELYFNVSPVIINETIMLPLRNIFEEFGANVEWDNGLITATKGDTVIKLWIDYPVYNLNGKIHDIEQPATIVNGRTLVPLRVVAEALGASVTWDGDSQTVTISTAPYNDEPYDDNFSENQEDVIDWGNNSNSTRDYDDNSSANQDNDVIYDDFSGPLSNNWDLSKAEGSWTIDPGTGAHGSSWGSFLPLKYIVTKNYTIECNIGFDLYPRDSNRYAGVFIKASDDYSHSTNSTPKICLFTHTYSDKDKNNEYYGEDVQTCGYGFEKSQKVKANMVPGEGYRLKVVVKDTNVDVYVDDRYMFSAVAKEKGNLVGLYTYSSSSDEGCYIKNFKITMDN